MLLFWVCAALLTAGVVLALTRPFVAGARERGHVSPAATDADANVAIYRDQLAEIENDKARGLLNEAEAEAARIEIARRLLATAGSHEAASRPPDAPATARNGSERAFFAVACAIPAVALGLYLALGSPGAPGRPIAERLARAPTASTDVEELVARVEAQLRANPSDGQGWDVIAPVYLRFERFQDSAHAYQRALDLLGESARRLSGLAESTVLANDGVVTETARKAYVRLLELEPNRVEAHFGLALAKEQDGDLDAADAVYHKLLEEAPIGAPWRQFIGERIDAVAARRAGSGPEKPKPQQGTSPKPGPAEVAAVTGLPEQQRRDVILGMVEGLAAKLKANGRDPDGWQRLIRSWAVLGENAKAEAALGEARKALAGDAKALGEIDAFAKSLGLKS